MGRTLDRLIVLGAENRTVEGSGMLVCGCVQRHLGLGETAGYE